MSVGNLATNATTQSVGNVVLASFIPGVDAMTLFCAFIGALIFVVSSNELPILSRIVYLPTATIGGYLAAGEVATRVGINSELAAFVSGAVIITAVLRCIKLLQTSDFSFFKRK